MKAADLDLLVAPLRADVVSGALVLAARASAVMREVAEQAPATSRASLQRTLGRLSLRILEAQPAMAPLVTLSCQVLASLEGPESLPEARQAASAAAESFRTALGTRAGEVAKRAAPHLPRGGKVLTVSSSSTVRATLLEAARTGSVEVVCLESRPLQEGRGLAAALAQAGLPVLYAVDAALESLLPGCSAVLLGADSVGDAGIVNKIGSAAAARAAARHGIPLVVVADRSKLLPRGFPQPLGDDRPIREVWSAPRGVRVWNRYFEAVDPRLARLVVTEQGGLTRPQLLRQRERLAVPALLRDWAASRA